MKKPRLCVFGAGAIGGYLAARLAQAGNTSLSVIARGAHLEAMRTRGITLVTAEGSSDPIPVHATDASSDLGPQDYVIITLKANAVPAVVPALQPLLGPETCVLMAVNGLPWWYFHALPSPWQEHRLTSLDPGDVQWTGIGPKRMLGCAVYTAAEVTAPGVIRHMFGNRFILGEPSGAHSDRIQALSALMSTAGLDAPISADIRTDIWVKLWGNLAFNPISALTGATMGEICSAPAVQAVARAVMLEGQAVAEALGVTMPITVDDRLAEAASVGAHKTSMLQDLERGRPLEIDPMVGVIAELARLTQVPTPALDMVLALIRLRAHTAGCS